MNSDASECNDLADLSARLSGLQAPPPELAQRAIAATPNGVALLRAQEPDFPVVYANPAFCRLSGYTPAGALAFLSGDTVRNALREAAHGLRMLPMPAREGNPKQELRILPLPGTPPCFALVLIDTSELHAFREQLAYQASHDALTGLPNRKRFDENLARAMAHAGRRGDALAVLCLGVDNVNLLNESLGHAAGEQLLASVAGRLRQHLRAHDYLGRHGGNEFVIVLGEVANAHQAGQLCEQLYQALAPSLLVAGQAVHAAASIGVAMYPQDGGDAATLLRYADLALSRARSNGGGQYQLFAPEMSQRALQRIQLEAALRGALEQDQLELLYQPVADLQSGAVCAVEALVRWQHPELGLVNASQFIPVAEEAALMGTIGDWILQRACRDLRAWQAAGLAPVPVALNVSPRQFRERGLANRIAHQLAECGVAPELLTLEITEAVLTHDAQASAHTLEQLKALGLSITLDDFGTGYSSLSHLRRFPLDQVKIDCDLTRNIVAGADDAALAKTIIAMAHHLGIEVVAEGVETEAQCDFLRRNMCDRVQGYFFSTPLDAAAIATLLRDGQRLPAHLLRIQKQKRTLLLVDDETNIVSALKRLLRRDDYQILTAHNGQEGLDVLAKNAVDVIVSDQRMPGMLGADFLRAAKGLYPDTIRIMLSGYTELQSVTDAVNEGAIYKFLTKPWEDDLLRGHIAEAFRLKEIADENERLNLELRTANHDLASANRRMEELLRQKQQQISRDEVSLNIARELLQFLPLPVIGLDDEGMIAFINAAADALFRKSGALLGNEAALVLPELFPHGLVPSTSHGTDIEGLRYDVVIHPMGASSQSRGSLITFSRSEVST